MATRTSTDVLREAANDHLREIRHRKGVDSSDGEHGDNVQDLNNALDILSDQLYQKETHFILELIQNADDNTFENHVRPSLSFYAASSTTAWQLLIICNETGFSKDNVESLCRIGHSTKKSKDRAKGYIGEKGIGFKSVFKVADTVHISSKAYSFRLDRKAMLGMITPIIEKFPPANLIGELEKKICENETHILLELLSEIEFTSICDELLRLQPQILIFLRKIRYLHIQTPKRKVAFVNRRMIEDKDFDGGETATLTKFSSDDFKVSKDKYLIIRRLHDNLAEDERRKNVKETEIVLAFPVDEWRPLVRAQDTYAHLPIGDYGFNYLIQADFLLVANRESVQSTEWNDRLRRAVYRTFVWTAVPRFNECDRPSSNGRSLRYTWPLFLQDRGGTNTFWSKLKKWIVDRLSNEDVLESRQKGKFASPASISYIPTRFRLNGQPLVEDKSSKVTHLSFLYDSEIANTLPELKRMGVKEMTFSQFYNELKDAIDELGHSFLTDQSEAWHSKVARLFRHYSNRLQSNNIPLIPLSDGRWVKPSHNNLLLEGESDAAEIPAGLNVFLVDPKACQDSDRLEFFKWLDIKRCDKAEICRMIVESYNPFRARSLNDSVQDVMYLFRTPRAVYKETIRNLQVLGAGRFGSHFRRTSAIYIDYPDKKSIVSKHSEHPDNPMPVVNPLYLETARKLKLEKEFVDWACSRLGISRLPHLVQMQSPSPAVHFLKTHAIEDLLLLLRDHWNHYSSDLEPSGSPSPLKKAISEMRVPCIDGISRRLDHTVLPREPLRHAGPDLHFLSVPESDDPRWSKFLAFGVLTSLSTEFYLRELKALADQPVARDPLKLALKVVHIYSRLRNSEDSDEIRLESLGMLSVLLNLLTVNRKAFSDCRLVYLQRYNRWEYLSECVWSGPQQLESIHRLSSIYPFEGSLFRDCLQLQDATLEHVIKELQRVTDSTPLKALQQLLLLLNSYLLSKKSSDDLDKLRGRKIIPVVTTSGEERKDFDTGFFYLADRQDLWDRFSGKIPLASFDVKTVRTLKPLIDAMGLSYWLLSSRVKQTLDVVGLKIEDKERTDDLRARSRHLVKLLPKETPERRSQLLTRLLNLNVWGVPAIQMTQEVFNVKVTTETKHILFDDVDASAIEIYISIKAPPKSVVTFELSKEFIRCCDITDHEFQKLVLPILQYPHEEIKELLEEYGLNDLIDGNEETTDLELPNSISLSFNNESNSFFGSSLAPALMSAPTTFLASSPNILDDRSSSQAITTPPLSDKIPALDQIIASVRKAAVLPGTAPSLTMTPSRIRTRYNTSASLHESDIQYSLAGDMSSSARLGSAVKPMNEATRPTSPEAKNEPAKTPTAFDFSNFHAEFSEAFGPTTFSISPSLPSAQQPRTSSTHNHYSTPQYNRSRNYSYNPSTHSATRMAPSPENTMFGLQMQKIGLLGETFVNEWLSYNLGDCWDPTNYWTSRNRNKAFPQFPFTDREKEYADFTYPDKNGKLTNLLANFIPSDIQNWDSDPPIYHLEVKSTSEGCNEPFYMSNNQLQKAREYTIPIDDSIIPKNIYAVVRVYSLEMETTTPGFTVYVDPWSLYLAGELEFLARDNYSVTPKVEALSD